MNPDFERPIILFLDVLCKVAPETGGRFADWWFDFADRAYYRACGTWLWRFWFELTGQGHDARTYMRRMYSQRWWETRGHARRRTHAEMRAKFEEFNNKSVPAPTRRGRAGL